MTEPLRYRRDVPRDNQAAVDAEVSHVIDHLASLPDPDDDPTGWRDHVWIDVTDHHDGDPALVSVVGELHASANAPYLRDGYDPDLDDDGTRFTRYTEENE